MLEFLKNVLFRKECSHCRIKRVVCWTERSSASLQSVVWGCEADQQGHGRADPHPHTDQQDRRSHRLLYVKQGTSILDNDDFACSFYLNLNFVTKNFLGLFWRSYKRKQQERVSWTDKAGRWCELLSNVEEDKNFNDLTVGLFCEPFFPIKVTVILRDWSTIPLTLLGGTQTYLSLPSSRSVSLARTCPSWEDTSHSSAVQSVQRSKRVCWMARSATSWTSTRTQTVWTGGRACSLVWDSWSTLMKNLTPSDSILILTRLMTNTQTTKPHWEVM